MNAATPLLVQLSVTMVSPGLSRSAMVLMRAMYRFRLMPAVPAEEGVPS
jgi:hypothetical protein